jgi:hypothetical protein
MVGELIPETLPNKRKPTRLEDLTGGRMGSPIANLNLSAMARKPGAWTRSPGETVWAKKKRELRI